ncbi:SH3 domain-containing protein [Sutcliffiella deserti]|uniref:SH3 domain-containing protein n=1 Tax=Sutcliffiella deserti TaxID=2875501 RepID=UPI001CBC7566|nr:SH3 domain-containing protein [Sutcliffiella deserti]
MKKTIIIAMSALLIGTLVGSLFTTSTSASSNFVIASVEWVNAQLNPIKDRITNLEENAGNSGSGQPEESVKVISSGFTGLKIVVSRTANIRSGLSTSTPAKINNSPSGTEFHYLQTHYDQNGNMWYEGTFLDGTTAYIVASHSTIELPSASSYSHVVLNKDANIRSDKSFNGSVVTQLKKSSVATYIQTQSNSRGETWYQIRLSDGTTAWVIQHAAEVVR